jgi:hypothetical protein
MVLGFSRVRGVRRVQYAIVVLTLVVCALFPQAVGR